MRNFYYDKLKDVIDGMTKEEKILVYDMIGKTIDWTKQNKENEDWIIGLPYIEKVETYNDRVVKVTFIDGTFTKAVCSDNDHFDLDVGITICAMKRVFGKNGNRHYNNYIRHAHAVIEANDKLIEEEARKKAEARMKRRKLELKRAAKKLKEKEEQIDIQKQAILRALDEHERSCMAKEDDLK